MNESSQKQLVREHPSQGALERSARYARIVPTTARKVMPTVRFEGFLGTRSVETTPYRYDTI
jgi:hypothetical protein